MVMDCLYEQESHFCLTEPLPSEGCFPATPSIFCFERPLSRVRGKTVLRSELTQTQSLQKTSQQEKKASAPAIDYVGS